MATAPGNFRREEPPPELRIESPLRTAAGTGVTAQLSVTNRASEARIMLVSVLGTDADWLPRPSRSRPVPPGATVVAEVAVAPSLGTVPARYPLAVVVEALDAVEGKPVGQAQVVDVELIVDAPGQIDLQLSPIDAGGVFSRRLDITIRNVGIDPAPVQLEAQGPAELHISLPQGEWIVPPGHTARVHGRIRNRRARFVGPPTRFGYTLTARSSGAPRHIEASFTKRAVFGMLLFKLLILAMVISLWVTLCIIYIPQIADFVRSNEASGQFKTPGASAPASPTKGNGSGGSGSGGNGSGGNGSGGNGSGGNGSGGNGSGGNGSGGNGSGGNGSGGSSSGGSGAAAAAARNSVQLNGTVGGTDPSGVTVSVSRTGLVDEAALHAKQNAASPASQFTADGMIPAAALVQSPPSVVAPVPPPVTTRQPGTWSFRVAKPGYYLLTFAKGGYETQRYVIDSTTVVSTKPIAVSLVPGQGLLRGTVTDRQGHPIGNAVVTITDGTSTVTTSSDSKGRGQVGHWSVDGLSTPSDYLVTATANNMGAESVQRTLTAGDRNAVANLTLKPGVTTLAGRVTGPDTNGNPKAPIGGAQISVSDGTITRSASSITAQDLSGGRPVGYYRIPNLPPGTYTETVEAPGYLVQSRRVVIKAGQSVKPVDSLLSSATATFSSVVKGDELDGNGDPTGAVQLEVDAGLTLTSSTNTYKLTTLNDGSFTFQGVAPGTYVLTAQFPNLDPTSETITLKAGDSIDDRAHPLILAVATITDDATIQGFVGDSTDPSNTLSCPGVPSCDITFKVTELATGTVKTINHPTITLTPGSSLGALPYNLAAVAPDSFAPGLYTLTISGVPSYLPATVRVQVPQHGVGRAPPVNLTRANSISGLITSVDGAPLGKTWDGASSPENCVVAEPVVAAAPNAPPTDCSSVPVAGVADTSTCSTIGQASTRGADIDGTTGKYEITGLCDGTYQVYAFVQNPDFFGSELVGAPSTLSVLGGTSAPYSTQISHKGGIALTVNKPNSAGGFTPVANAAIDATCTDPASNSQHRDTGLSTDSAGRVTIPALNEGDESCDVKATPASGTALTGSFVATVARNSNVSAVLTLVAAIGAVNVTVQTTFPSAGGLDGATVSVQGITHYVNGQPVTEPDPPVPVTLSGHCFYVVPNSSTVPTGCVGTSDTIVLPFVTPSLNVDVSKPGYQDLHQALSALDTRPSQTLTLTPAPVPFALALRAPGGSVTDLTNATIQVTQSSSAAGAVVVGVDASTSGSTPCPDAEPCQLLTWSDPNVARTGVTGTNAMPGNYALKITMAGYAVATVNISCTLGGACHAACPAGGNADCASDVISMRKLGTLTINTVDASGAGVDGATIGVGIPGAAPQTVVPTGNSAPFGNLVPDTYALTVKAAGYAFVDSTVDSSMVSCTGTSTTLQVGANSTVVCTVTLTALGSISGTVEGVRALVGSNPAGRVQDALSNVRLSARQCTDSTCATVTGHEFTAVTNPDGSFSIAGTATDEGLKGRYWLITPTLAGWDAPPVTQATASNIVDLGDPGGPVTGAKIFLFTHPVDLHVLVLDSSGAPVTTSDLSFTLRDSRANLVLAASPTAPATPAGTACAVGHADCHDWIYQSIVPTSYALIVQNLTQWTINASLSLNPGVSPVTATVQANATAGSVTGTVTALQGASTTPTAMPGVVVALFQGGVLSRSTTGSNLQITTTGNGFIAFTNVPVSSTPYDIHVTPPAGYTNPADIQSQLTVDSAGTIAPIAPIELVRVTHKVNVTLAAPSADNLTGLVAATLTPKTTGDNLPFTAQNLTGSAGSFTTSFLQVPFNPTGSPYTLTLTLPADQLDTPSGLTCIPSLPLAASVITRTCTTTVDVPNTGTQDIDNSFTLDESMITFLVSAGPPPANDPTGAPSTVDLAIQKVSATGALAPAIYHDTGFAVGGTSAAVWVPDDDTAGLTYRLTASGGNGWAGTADATRASTTTTDAGYKDWGTTTVTINQQTGTIFFQVTDNKGHDLANTDTPVITITPPSPFVGPTSVPTDAGAHPSDAGGTATQAGFPFGTGWSATASDDSGATNGTAVPFAVTSSCTTSAPCTVTLQLP
jgi:hypothetical protein